MHLKVKAMWTHYISPLLRSLKQRSSSNYKHLKFHELKSVKNQNRNKVYHCNITDTVGKVLHQTHIEIDQHMDTVVSSTPAFVANKRLSLLGNYCYF